MRRGSLADFVLPDSDDGMTLLHLVVSVDDFSAEYLDKLLDTGADPNAASTGGVTAPHIAAASGNEEALRRLLGRGGDPRRREPRGKRRVSRLSDEELREQLAACFGHDVRPVLDSKSNVHRHALAHYRLGPCARVRLASPDASFWSASNGNNRAGIARTCDFCEVVHKDPDTGFVLKEEHYHSSSEADSSGTSGVSCSGAENDTVVVHPELACLMNEQLFAKLTSLGDAPGPVTDGTRAVYLKRLARLTSGLVTLHKSRDVVSPRTSTRWR
ncbi:hypothetical protein MTO96_027954 [Rhipicephalus appendiculatus]